MCRDSLNIDKFLVETKNLLSQAGFLMALLSHLIIVSQLWYENDKVCIIVWMPDINSSGGLFFVRKKIVYDLERKQLIEIRDIS